MVIINCDWSEVLYKKNNKIIFVKKQRAQLKEKNISNLTKFKL